MIKNIFFIYYCLIASWANAQGVKPSQDNFVKMSQILPPSPDAAAVGKYGGVNIDLSTGSMNQNIKLKPFQDKKLEIPIMLLYNSNGIKVNEYPSRVGMGWSFHAGGQISRVVRGRDDFMGPRAVPTFTVVPNTDDIQFTDFMWKTTDQGKDSEPDLFSYNFGEYSGSFIFDNSGVITPLEATNLKIEYVSTGSNEKFRITTPEGIIYYFGKGNAIEQTKFGSGIYNQYITNVWCLYKILHPTGYFTTLTYTDQALSAYMVNKDETDVSLAPTWTNSLCDGPTNCIDGFVTDNYEEIYMNSKVSRLTEITASTGAKVVLEYTNSYHPDKLLSSIIYTNENNAQILKYNFGYNATTNGVIPFLLNIKEYDAGNVQQHNGHEFEYQDMNSMPARLSLSQDHWGYYNGKPNSTLIARPENEEIAMKFPNATADRNADPAYAVVGLLSKIKYPTGGKDIIEYESNRGNVYKDINGYLETSGSITAPTNAWYYSTPVTIVIGYDTKIKVSTSCTIPGGGTVPIQWSGMIEIAKVGTVHTQYYVPNSPNAIEFIHLPSGTYTFKVGAKGDNVSMNCTLKYRDGASPNMQYISTDMGGMRVKKISSYQHNTANPVSKRYYYGTFADLNYSSAQDARVPQYLTDYPFISVMQGSACMSVQYIEHNHLALHCSPLNNIYLQDGNLLKYTSVIESFGGDNFENGAVEHKFQFLPDDPALNIRGILNYECPLTNSSNSSLGEIETHTYKKGTTSLIPVSSVIKTVTLDNRKYKSVPCLNIGRGPFLTCATFAGGVISGPEPVIHKLFSAQKYYVTAVWKYTSKETTKTYDQNGLNPLIASKEYFYDNVNNLMPSRMETLNSKGEILKTTYKYPHDLSVNPNVYWDMVNKNIVSPVVEIKSYKSSTLLSTESLNYSNAWFGDQHVVALDNVHVQKEGSSDEERFKFYSYDTYGNPLELSKSTDKKQSYIWEYNQDYPVAKVENASSNTIAYSSFETTSKGNWTYSGTSTPNTGAPTGKKVYQLSTGAITKAGLDNTKTYIISYWSNGGQLSSIGGTITSGKTLGAFTYYEHKVINPSSVSISGSVLIDELRLYPQDAFMTTFTYEPLVGMTSQSDVNSDISYYEYDSYYRLSIIRDMDKNIVKKICYNYAGQAENCTSPCYSTDPVWQNTSAPLRCQVSACTYTGYQEQEQQNVNICSSSYGQKQWINAGYNPSACSETLTSLTSVNNTSLSGLVIEYTNTATGITYPFNIPPSSTANPLGCVPLGIYDVRVHTVTGPGAEYWISTNTLSGDDVTFYNIDLHVKINRTITIQLPF